VCVLEAGLLVEMALLHEVHKCMNKTISLEGILTYKRSKKVRRF
jgi:hypothetical protein